MPGSTSMIDTSGRAPASTGVHTDNLIRAGLGSEIG